MQNYKNLKVDLSNCDKEPIHIIGRIQPHGFMLILDHDSLLVEQASENVAGFLGIEASSLIGQSLEVLCSGEGYMLLEQQLRNAVKLNPQLLLMQEQVYFGFVHLSAGKLVLECEPAVPTAEQQRLENAYQFAQFQTDLNELDTMAGQSQLVVDYVQRVLDYDRVMLYKFDEDWNGEVIADRVKPGVHSYLHHHFPASDIPAPARALLEKKQVRQIPDVQAQAVDIVPYLNPATGSPSNIILSELRNPSEIHLEYLRNMDVSATLSFSIMVKGKLWGLITCQHLTPVFKDYWKRQLCYLIAKAFSNAILSDSEQRDVQTLAQSKKLEEELIQRLSGASHIGKELFEGEVNLLHLTGCSAAALYFNHELIASGQGPDESQVMQIIDWLSENNTSRVFSTRQLSSHMPGAEAFRANASGLLALEISRYNKEYILYFKPEIKETRIWAGNPDKPLPGGDMRIHPRKSFQNWTEVIKGKSEPWTVNELEITQMLLKDITAIILRNQASQLKQLNQELKLYTQDLHVKNSRLEDFAHIITHNLRSPLKNIKGLHSLYLAEPTNESAAEIMEHISKMTDNISATIDDLNLILKAAIEQQLPQCNVQLHDIIEKEIENLQAEIKQTDAKICTDLQVPALNMPKVYLESIMHNLLSNALKYRGDRPPLITVRSWQEEHNIYLSVADNGLGMDLGKVGPKLFGLYNTFHRKKDAKGLGLYLTRMQVEGLGGKISVESAPEKGTTFTVQLPRH
ncbi:ATP-binding protein [Pontibacter actiniarum]|uniref:histidine kinase n=1 Tax=Pontibacter actiniarum TaxID=323450 RepID=A0A1X9YQ61_9BACT|nr:ATP-binding protein [Pontibacter actiniarum]ARS35015.1 hypothetical protein CA264_05925 [Pontibacter actiniarum]